jgi:hypothetical protein
MSRRPAPVRGRPGTYRRDSWPRRARRWLVVTIVGAALVLAALAAGLVLSLVEVTHPH